MIDKFKENILTLWNNTYNAQTWEQATVVVAVLATMVVSFIFVLRMLSYRQKTFLDWTILFREIGWFLVAFRFTTALGMEWEGWMEWSWLIWSYVAITTILAFLASQRERYYARHRRSPIDRLLRRNLYPDKKEN